MDIKIEIESLRKWREENLTSTLKEWEAMEKEENKVFSAHAAMYVIQFKTKNDAISAYKFVHRCSLQDAVKAIDSGEEQLMIDTSL